MNFNFFDLFWVFLAISSVQPLLQKYQIGARRVQALKQFEQQRNSRVILLIHRQESLSLLGIPLSRYITIEDSEPILRAVRLTPPYAPLRPVLPESKGRPLPESNAKMGGIR